MVAADLPGKVAVEILGGDDIHLFGGKRAAGGQERGRRQHDGREEKRAHGCFLRQWMMDAGQL
jgi:hypothetical protein